MNWRMEFHYADGGRHFIDAQSPHGYAEAAQLMAAWPTRQAGSRVMIADDHAEQEIELTDVVRLTLEVSA